jgi:DNA-binding SARP family transcriptional activator
MVWLALRRSPVDRNVAAGLLWPAVDDRRAAGNLRSALWRLRGAGLELVDCTNTALALRAEVTVDVHIAADWAQRLNAGCPGDGDVRLVPWFAQATNLLSGWDDDWAILERERLRHRTLHAFEQLSRMLRMGGRYTEAVRAAQTVVAADPLRESAQYALIEAHLAAGDVAASRHAVQTYSRLHTRAFGVEPSPRLLGLTSSPDVPPPVTPE